MEALFQKIHISRNKLFVIKDNRVRYFNRLFHFHPEYELICIWEGSGQCLIGDQMFAYGNGELLLLGPNLPHSWISDLESKKASRSIVIQLNQPVWPEKLLTGFELQPIANLLARSDRGILFTDPKRDQVNRRMARILEMDEFEGLVEVLRILNQLAGWSDYRNLVSPAYNLGTTKGYHRINRVFEYVMDHYQQPIKLAAVASQIHLTESAFCRYFKKITRKTFVQYLNEYRVGEACRLIRDSDFNIAQISLESGFESISNFNREFKRFTSMSPRDYRKRVIANPTI